LFIDTIFISILQHRGITFYSCCLNLIACSTAIVFLFNAVVLFVELREWLTGCKMSCC